MSSVPPVAQQPEPSAPLAQMRKLYGKSVAALKVTTKVARLFRYALKYVEFFRDLSKVLNVALHISKGPPVLLGLVAVKNAVDDIRKVVDRTKRQSERIVAMFAFVIHLDTVVTAISEFCKLVAAVETTFAKAIKWIPIFDMFSFAVGFVSLGLSAYSTHQSRRLYQAFHGAMNKVVAAKDEPAKRAAFQEVLDVFEKEGIEPLKKYLVLSKGGVKDLAKRVDSLRGHIAAQKFDATDEQFVKTLVGRTKFTLGLGIVDMASDVAFIGGAAISLIPVPVAAQVVGTTLLATNGVISLVRWGHRHFCINKNPFDDTSKSRAEAMLDALSKAVHTLRQRLQTIHVGKRKIPVRVGA